MASRGCRTLATVAGAPLDAADEERADRAEAEAGEAATPAVRGKLGRGAPVDAAIAFSAYNARVLYARLPVGSRGGLVPGIERLVICDAARRKSTAS